MKQYTTEEMVAKYGKPNQAGTYLASANIPFPLVIAWDDSVTVSRIRCHKLEVANVEDIFGIFLMSMGWIKFKPWASICMVDALIIGKCVEEVHGHDTHGEQQLTLILQEISCMKPKRQQDLPDLNINR